tara:strand:+ start:995 stop:1633 length:639 start_codon:yes stop_codon:yes gene_type:complete
MSEGRRSDMAKSSRKRKNSSSALPPKAVKKKVFPVRYVVYGVAVLALIGAGYGFFTSQQVEGAFDALAAAGKGELERVEEFPSEGRTHLAVGSEISYGTHPPTSGPHYLQWINPGFYETLKGWSNLVHSLEHGMIVIYYDRPADDALETLKSWTSLFTGPWSGIVMVRKAGLGEKLILTAWRRMLRLERFEIEAAAAFINAYRGRGPENPVR